MKRQVILLLALLMQGIQASSFAAESIPAHVPPSMPPDLVNFYLHEGSTYDSGGITNEGGRGVKFGQYLTDHWREMVDRWPLGSMEEVRMGVFCGAAELMPPAEYVLFMDRMVTEHEKGRLTYGDLLAFIAPSGSKMGFVNVNFRHPDVRRVIVRLRCLSSTHADRRKWCDRILSGALVDQMDDLIGNKGYDILPLDVLPLSGGVKEHYYRVSPVKAVVATAKVFPQVVQTINWIEIVVLGVMAVAAAWLWRLWRRIRQRNASASSSSPP